jgi:hypothetical protein
MGETRYMFESLTGDLLKTDLDEIQKALYEIASGSFCFGDRAEWRDWFHYLLVTTAPRVHEIRASRALVESLVTAFVSQYPDDVVDEAYPGFRMDALNLLGKRMMDASCWEGTEIRIGAFLHRGLIETAERWCWDDASGDFSASMFFCLKYLAPEQIGPWLASALSIPAPHWRTQLVVWFVGAHDLLCGRVAAPSHFTYSDRPSLCWEASHLLQEERFSASGGRFLPAANCAAAIDALHAHMTEEVFLDWMSSFARVDYLESELAELPDRFWELYGAAR